MEHFAIREDIFGTETRLTVTDTRTHSTMCVLPSCGARLNSLSLMTDKGMQNVLEGYETEESLSERRFARSGLMAPFPNRIKDGVYIFDGTAYLLPLNKPAEHNACHGFIMNAPFTITSRSEIEGAYHVTLSHTCKGMFGYPFPFHTSVTYIFSGTTIHIVTAMTNIGNNLMPIGFGWHPYFTTGTPVDQLFLHTSPVERIVVDERLIPTGEVVPYHTHDTFTQIHNTQFDTGFHFLGTHRKVTLNDPVKKISISVEMNESPYEYVQLFIPPSRTSLAIEPMTCATNALNNGCGLTLLDVGKTLSARYQISVTHST